MEGGTLFNPGFLGNSFLWWIGQIVDDSTWRDNILPGKFADANTIPGWGRRYKVRIIGLHDREEETIPSDQLPWAQVMYPITAGGGQTGSSQTPNLRQGNFVFGFFLDGQDQQVPVIMGVLGNNAQTALSTKIGTTESNFAGTSGYAAGKNPPKGNARPVVPDEDKVVVKPKTPEQAAESAPIPPGTTLDKYGLPFGKATQAQLADIQTASVQATEQGLIGTAFDEYVKNFVQTQTKNRAKEANSPSSPSQPGATRENADAVHQISSADLKRQDKYEEKIPLMKPDDKVGSAIRGIQVTLDNLMKEIKKYLDALSCYASAVSSLIGSLQDLISKAACIIAKYMKIVFDKIMEYTLKILNKELTRVVSAMPSSMRYMLGDLKEIITELILCLYNKITQGLCGLIEGLLNGIFVPEELENQVQESISNGINPDLIASVPICYAEVLVGQVIAYNKEGIDSANNTILDNINVFLEDTQNQIAGVSSSLADITSLLGNINGSMSSALSFENLTLDLFGCELKPNPAVSDFYTLATGGAAQPDSQIPLVQGVNLAASKEPPSTTVTSLPPFADIPASAPDVKLTSDARTPDEIIASTSNVG